VLETTRRSWMWRNHRILCCQRLVAGRLLGNRSISISNGDLTLVAPPHLHLRCYSWTGELSANVAALVSVLSRDGGTFLDIGAFAGQHSQRAVRASEGAMRVIAFEPDPHAKELLVLNLREAGLENAVTVRHEAVSDCNGIAHFVVADVPSLSGLGASASGASVEVPTVDLLDLVEEYEPTLIKMDVEGHESTLLRRLASLDPQRLPVVIAENNPGALAAAKLLDVEAITTRAAFPDHAGLSNLSDDLLLLPRHLATEGLLPAARASIDWILRVPSVKYVGSRLPH
jgi:FkbM family methyltransferase